VRKISLRSCYYLRPLFFGIAVPFFSVFEHTTIKMALSPAISSVDYFFLILDYFLSRVLRRAFGEIDKPVPEKVMQIYLR